MSNDPKGGEGEDTSRTLFKEVHKSEARTILTLSGKAGCLLKMLDDRIDSFQKKRQKNRGYAFKLKMTSTLFSALITVILGLKVAEDILGPSFNNIALCLSASVTLISTWESFFDHKNLWVNYSKTRAQLSAVRAELLYLSSDLNQPLPDEKVDPLFRQYQTILAESNASWLQLRSEGTDKTDRK